MKGGEKVIRSDVNAKTRFQPEARGFTLIELLVVIGLIALLMAILLPVLGRVRQQTRNVVCQSNLRQWGVVLSMYMNDNDGKSFSALEVRRWPTTLRSYYTDCNDLLLCPVATRYEEAGNPLLTLPRDVGSVSRTWKMQGWGADRVFYGSYGLNQDFPAYCSPDFLHVSGQYPRASPIMPVLLDCISPFARVWRHDAPPEYEGQCTMREDMKHFCISRHSGCVNGLFLNASVRRIGLKELWILGWSPSFDTAGPWTTAGGVEPGDWPKWMRQFKDY